MAQGYLDKILSEFSDITIDEAACIRLTSPRSTCHLCEDICPVDAISIDKEVTITNTCISCGSCVGACPVGVYKINNPSDNYLLNRAKEAGKISITCKKNAENLSEELRDGLVQVECVFRFYSEILFAIALETEGDIHLYCDETSCKNCQQEENIQELLREIDKANNYLRLIDEDNSIQLLNDFPQDITVESEEKYSDCDESKRQFFTQTLSGVKKISTASVMHYIKDNKKMVKNILKNEIDESYEDDDEEESKPFLTGQEENFKRKLLIDTLKKNASKIKPDNLKQELPINKLQVNNCYLCRVCERLCPQSAIKITKNGEIEINYSLCSNCGLCIDVCNTNSITFGEPLMLEEFFSEDWSKLAESEKNTCQTCNETFEAANNDNGLCLKCKMQSILFK